eukprot:12880626-Prorocentrum_lima.AAC.1
MTVDASRGRMAPMVHVLKHPRTVDAPSIDQHHGIRGDMSPGSVSYTRARRYYSIWLEKQDRQEPRVSEKFGRTELAKQ